MQRMSFGLTKRDHFVERTAIAVHSRLLAAATCAVVGRHVETGIVER